ncbi:MAG: hypothetical protein CMN55_15805 [Sneathiella sp.]|jgi:hypothetical protein|uniref:hypothetical protein n=1 Tax=Sneathiella sp. TaxID=1964365 RepID=UPI000C4BDD70|nr:hypothetical protein [Sneathiella sp.]MAL80544.1 hypothetical protein [Sneathiella sp.]|tara:strand:- start:410 stop:682 length:273 start_codon:yes stop_codon:yes gene_type:complete
MIRTGRKKEWSILLFVVFLIALLPPVIMIFDTPRRLLGIPIIFLYLFTVWGAAIALTALGAKRGKGRETDTPLSEQVAGEPSPPPIHETR